MDPYNGFMQGIQRLGVAVAMYAALQPRPAVASHTTLCNHTRLFISSGGPLKDKNDMIRLHVIMRLVFAYIAIIICVKIGVFVRWGTCKTYTP